MKKFKYTINKQFYFCLITSMYSIFRGSFCKRLLFVVQKSLKMLHTISIETAGLFARRFYTPPWLSDPKVFNSWP